MQQGSFAAAVIAHQCQKFSGINFEIDIVDHRICGIARRQISTAKGAFCRL